ncbi:MAG TPA: class I SAM-dependent methyltransferase [Herpetosiphonaceae bacterium]|nr:class I SAM-dependent methyltransferase [Herpetosiphonaceae bacterium]
MSFFRNLPYRFPRLYDLVVYRGIFGWLGMNGAAQSAIVAGVIERDGRLLETPIGTGALTFELYSQRPALSVFGLDLSRDMLAEARRRLDRRGITNVHLICADMMVLPFAADTFNQIVSLNGLHVVPRHESAIDELLRVAEDGAVVVGTAGVDIGKEPRGGLQKLLARLGFIRPLDADKLHELLGMTWSKLAASRSGAVYAFRRPRLDPATGEPVTGER